MQIPAIPELIQPQTGISQKENHWKREVNTTNSNTKIMVEVVGGDGFWIMNSKNYDLFFDGEAFNCAGKHCGSGLRWFLPPSHGKWFVVAHRNGQSVADISSKWRISVSPAD